MPQTQFFRAILFFCLLAATPVAQAAPPLSSPPMKAGSPEEKALVVKSQGASLVDNARHAEAGQFWVYGFAVSPTARCQLRLTLDDGSTTPIVAVLGLDNKELPTRSEHGDEGTCATYWTVPEKWPIGARMRVLISAKTGPVTVRQIQLISQEQETNGIPNSILTLMTQGVAANERPVLVAPSRQPHTLAVTSVASDPTLDLQTDAILLEHPDAALIASWKARGYTVWTQGGARVDTAYAAQHPDEVQTDTHNKPLNPGSPFALLPTPGRIAAEVAAGSSALDMGSDGICLLLPEIAAQGGYEGAFRKAWQQQFNTPWQAPGTDVNARWQFGQLSEQLESNFVSGTLGPLGRKKPQSRQILATFSPLWNIQQDEIGMSARAASLSEVDEILGEVNLDTTQTPARYAGVRTERAFDLAYLQYSSLAQMARGNGKRLWFQIDPSPRDPGAKLPDFLRRYEQLVVAGLLFPDVDAYQVTSWPERIYGHLGNDYVTEFSSIVAALQEMRFQPAEKGNAMETDLVGVLISDTIQWQRGEPSASDIEGIYGLALPLLQHGVPVQLASLDRAADPGYLKPFKTLLLSYDFQKPLNARIQSALADWVRHGGSLMFFGGQDPYNGISNSWWRTTGLTAPQEDLWRQLGIPQAYQAQQVPAPPADDSHYTVVIKSPQTVRDMHNRGKVTVDLTPFVQATGSVAIRFGNSAPQMGRGATLIETEIHIDKQLAAAFQTGVEMENRFLVTDQGSQYDGTDRYVDGTSTWTYQFDNLPRGVPVTLQLDIGNNYEIAVASVQPDYTHTLIHGRDSGAIGKVFPRVRIGAAYPITVYPGMVSAEPPPSSGGGPQAPRFPNADNMPAVLYNLRSGGVPAWTQQIDKGLVLTVGVAPGFFSASERSAALLRAFTQYAVQRAGGTFHAPGFLKLQRGRYIIVKTFTAPVSIDGRTIDLFSPTLDVANDRTVPARSYALLYNLGDEDSPPHIGFVSGRVLARLEADTTTAFFVRGPKGTTGVARLHSGGKRLTGAAAFDRMGHRILVETSAEGNTVLLHYANDPDGIMVRVGWR